MADDDKDAKISSAAVPSDTSDTARVTSAPRSEWTASDARGPLSAAEADAERTRASEVPVSEAMPSDAEAATPELTPVGEAPGVAPETASPVTPPHAVGEAPRRSSMPILAGLVIGAVIGAGSAAAVDYYLRGDSSADQQIAALNTKVEALAKRPDPQAAIDGVKSSLGDLDGKVAAAQKTAAAAQASAEAAEKKLANPPAAAKIPAFDPAPLDQKIAALQSRLDKMQGAGAQALDGKIAALVAGLAALKQQDAGLDGKVAALQQDAAGRKDLDAKVSALEQDAAARKGLDTKVDGLATSLAAMEKQGSTTQASVDTLATRQKSLEGKVTSAPSLAVVADSLVQQIDRGAPYAGQVDALTTLGADPAKIAVLRENADKGVPSAKTLAAAFEPLVDPIVATEHRAPPDASFMDKLKSGMFSMVSVRRADDTTGTDLASRVAKIQADLTHGDVGGAYATWNALPADAKAKSDTWGAQAKTHVEAMSAARALQQQAITALGTKKS